MCKLKPNDDYSGPVFSQGVVLTRVPFRRRKYRPLTNTQKCKVIFAIAESSIFYCAIQHRHEYDGW